MTVFVVQRQMRWDNERKELVPRFPEVERAEEFGKLSYILSPSDHPYNPDLILGKIHSALQEFNDQDHVLLIGSPALIGMVTAIAAHYNAGRVNFLIWNGKHSSYDKIESRMF